MKKCERGKEEEEENKEKPTFYIERLHASIPTKNGYLTWLRAPSLWIPPA